jgi:hypothetical protein
MDTREKNLNKEQLQTCYNKNPMPLQMRRDWLQASRLLNCKPTDSLELSKKKLMREKKMEGTWTAEKAPRKTPPSQTKETARNNGGVKRPHSDSSSPSLGKQQPKKKQEHPYADWDT